MTNPDALPPTSAQVSLELAVIIPCHNEEETLAEQLDALTHQLWDRPWGIVVVDNGSKDGTAAIARRYEDRGVRLVTANAGKGVAYARNSGAKAVDSAAVAFCDGDDVVHPGWVAAMGNALENADIVSGQLDTNTLNPGWMAETRPMGRPGKLPTFGIIEFASGGNCAIRREVFERLGGYDEDFVGLEDIEFSLRARAMGASIAAAPDAVLSYRMREGLKAVWRQGLFYGRGRPALIARAKHMGLPAPSRLEGLRSWGWLVVNLPSVRTRTGRHKLVWVLANRIGVLRGAIAARSFYI